MQSCFRLSLLGYSWLPKSALLGPKRPCFVGYGLGFRLSFDFTRLASKWVAGCAGHDRAGELGWRAGLASPLAGCPCPKPAIFKISYVKLFMGLGLRAWLACWLGERVGWMDVLLGYPWLSKTAFLFPNDHVFRPLGMVFGRVLLLSPSLSFFLFLLSSPTLLASWAGWDWNKIPIYM